MGPVTAAVAEGCVEAAGEPDPLGFAVGLGDAIGSPLLIGSIRAPWSGSATATVVPSGLIASGPSSGPSDRGNGFSTPASAFSQYHVPVPTSRTATRPELPGASPSVKKAACAGGLESVFRAPAVRVRSRASTS